MNGTKRIGVFQELMAQADDTGPGAGVEIHEVSILCRDPARQVSMAGDHDIHSGAYL
jgi:hypothetical protein